MDRSARPPPAETLGCHPYEITTSGLAAFMQWFMELPHGPLYRDVDLDTRAFFFGEVAPIQAASALRAWRSALARTARDLQADLASCLTGRDGDPKTGAVLAKRKLRYVAADYSLLEDLYDEFALDGIESMLDIPTVR